MGSLLVQKYETRICVCTQQIAMLCGSVTCQIRFALQHMHSFFECQWKLHAFIVGRPAVESQYCILSYSLLKILWLEKHYFLESSYTTDKTIRPLKSYLRLSLTAETFQKAFEIQVSKIMYAAPYSGYKAVRLLLHDVQLCILLFWGLNISKK